jgi:hypothetical protein
VAKSSVASIPVLGSARNVQTRFGTLISGSASPIFNGQVRLGSMKLAVI